MERFAGLFPFLIRRLSRSCQFSDQGVLPFEDCQLELVFSGDVLRCSLGAFTPQGLANGTITHSTPFNVHQGYTEE
jgi:hypothetical protein